MSSDLEKLILDGLDVAGEDTGWFLRDLKNPPPAKLAEWSGTNLTAIPKRDRMVIEATLELHQQADMDTALDSLGTLTEKLAECERTTPGLPVTRTPANSTRPRLTYAMLGGITGVPVEDSGSLSGWLRKGPVVHIRLECFPGWLGTPVVGTEVTSTDPVVVADVTPDGDADALPIITVRDASSNDQLHVEIACDLTDDTSREYVIDATALDSTGYAGSATTRSSVDVVRATLSTTPVVICRTAALDYLGSFRLKPRVYGDGSGTISVRVDHQSGDSPWVEGSWVEVPGLDDYYELEDRYAPWIADFTEATDGTQSSRIRIVAKSTVGGDTLDVQSLYTLGGEFYAVARGPFAWLSPEAFTGADSFQQTAGALNGKTPDVGSSWAGTAATFYVDSSREDADTTDATGGPVRMTLGSVTNDPLVMGATISGDSTVSSDSVTDWGVVRWNSTTSLLFFGWRYRFYSTGALAGNAYTFLVLGTYEGSAVFQTIKSETLLHDPGAVAAGDGFPVDTSATLELRTADDRYQAYYNGVLWASGTHAYLDTMGTARGGIYRWGNSASVESRYDDFYVYTFDQRAAIHADRDLILDHDSIQRASSDGTLYARPPLARGAGSGDAATLLPRREGQTCRVMAKARRTDAAESPDTLDGDSIGLQVTHLPVLDVPR